MRLDLTRPASRFFASLAVAIDAYLRQSWCRLYLDLDSEDATDPDEEEIGVWILAACRVGIGRGVPS